MVFQSLQCTRILKTRFREDFGAAPPPPRPFFLPVFRLQYISLSEYKLVLPTFLVSRQNTTSIDVYKYLLREMCAHVGSILHEFE